jgi:cold shock CspA family protein
MPPAVQRRQMLPAWQFPHTAARGRLTRGHVAELSRGRMSGVIRAADSQRVFFHGRDLEGARYNDVTVGAPVTFELIADPISGPRATRVRVRR